MKKHILLIDDDALMRRSLSYNLQQAGFDVESAASAEEGLSRIDLKRPDIVLLDINLPGMDGLDALKRIRVEMGLPVIFVTARRRELDEILGLELGADDYITKPFDFDVLLARVKAVLRRASERPSGESAPPSEVKVGDLVINADAHTVMKGGSQLELSPREFDLLYNLAIESGKVVSSDELLARVWGANFIGEPQVLYVHIRWLREKIEADPQNPQHILTVRGVGYKLV